MKRKELSDLPEPKYLLYPNQLIYRGLMALPVIAFLAYLNWVFPLLLNGATNVWHWFFLIFLGVMTIGVLLPKSNDWRNLITFAATPEGVWFVTKMGDDCVFLPWHQVHDVYKGSILGRGQSVKAVIFKVEGDRDTKRRLNQHSLDLFEVESSRDNGYKVGLSSNLRKLDTIIEQVEYFRNLDRRSD